MYERIENYIERLLNNSAPEAPLWNIESIKGGKKPHWNYIDGCMMTALLCAGEITEEKKYFDFAEKFIDYYVKEDGSILGYSGISRFIPTRSGWTVFIWRRCFM